MKFDLIGDNLWKLLWKLSVPGILGMMVISINGLIDIFYITTIRKFAFQKSLRIPYFRISDSKI